jgi:hypothetical protein
VRDELVRDLAVVLERVLARSDGIEEEERRWER